MGYITSIDSRGLRHDPDEVFAHHNPSDSYKASVLHRSCAISTDLNQKLLNVHHTEDRRCETSLREQMTIDGAASTAPLFTFPNSKALCPSRRERRPASIVQIEVHEIPVPEEPRHSHARCCKGDGMELCPEPQSGLRPAPGGV